MPVLAAMPDGTVLTESTSTRTTEAQTRSQRPILTSQLSVHQALSATVKTTPVSLPAEKATIHWLEKTLAQKLTGSWLRTSLEMTALTFPHPGRTRVAISTNARSPAMTRQPAEPILRLPVMLDLCHSGAKSAQSAQLTKQVMTARPISSTITSPVTQPSAKWKMSAHLTQMTI